jgi:rubrerythrin
VSRFFIAIAAVSLCLVGCLLLAGCGGGGDTTDGERSSDAEILNAALAQELTQVDAYTQGLSLLHGQTRVLGQRLRSQEQEHIDALVKSIKGLEGEVDAEAEELDFAEVKTQDDFLTLAYELGSSALASYIDASPNLYTSAPRVLASSLAASEAQHLVILRQALGADLAESIPKGFDIGEEPPPEPGKPPPGQG